MKKLHDAEVKNKTVLVRCDFNVTVKDGEVVDDFRITQAMPTIKDLAKRGSKVVLMSHMGRPDNQKSFKKEGTFSSLKDIIFKEDREDSLKPVYKKLDMLLDNVFFVNDCIGKRVDRKVKNLNPGEILLLENLRYYEDEEKGGKEFSKRLSSVADIYVNNAFSASHRDHASISGVTNYLSSYPGYLFEREVKFLTRLKKDPERPFVVIVGGAKVSSKAKTIKYFMKKADKILVGGKVANAILTIRGLTKKSKLPEKDVLEKLKDINLTSQKLYLPVDVVASSDYESYIRRTSVGEVRKEEDIFDIGPETTELFNNIIRESETVVWAGPLGFFENEKFEKGTSSIAKRVVENDNALKVVGGGDTGFALKKFGLRDYIDHVSLGGGAMLTFLSDEKMPGLDSLK